MQFAIRGVHPIEAAQSCHLIEVELTKGEDFDWDQITQEDLLKPQSDWQVAYDEQELEDKPGTWVFFFHYLDFSKPLMTPVGQKKLPAATPLPEHLNKIEYFEP